MKVLLAAAVLLFASEIRAQSPETKGLDIAMTIDAANDGFKDESNTSHMVLINAHGDKVVRKMSMVTKEVDGDGDRSLITFEWPADLKGTRMLTWTHLVGNDDQWLYLPAFNKVRRISSRNKSGAFMGSEFAYEDISSLEIEKFTWKWLKDEKLRGRNCWVLERVPTYRSGYSRQVVWIDEEYQSALQIEYYDRKGELLKTSVMSGYKKFGNYWRFARNAVVNHQTRKRSILTISDRKLGVGLDASDFEKRNLSE